MLCSDFTAGWQPEIAKAAIAENSIFFLRARF